MTGRTLDLRRRRLRAVLAAAAMLGIGSASLSGALAALAAAPAQAAPGRAFTASLAAMSPPSTESSYVTDTLAHNIVNGIDLDALQESVDAIRRDPAAGRVEFRVKTQWTGRTRSESLVESCRVGGEEIPRRFKIVADEPSELLGGNSAPNPQELLLSALNACMMVGYVAQAAVRGIALEDVRIETESELDLRGFHGLDEGVPSGSRRIDFVVHLQGDGTPEQHREIHEAVMATSPNHFNMTRAIELNGRLV